MRTIRIVSGVYGHRPAGNRYTERKRAGDPPFEIEEDKAARLVALGVAEYADAAKEGSFQRVATGHIGENSDEAADNSSDESDAPKSDLEGDNAWGRGDDAPEVPPYNTDMKMDELREILNDCGIPFKVGMSKEDIVDVLDEYFYGADDEPGDEDDDLPGFDDEDVVP